MSEVLRKAAAGYAKAARGGVAEVVLATCGVVDHDQDLLVRGAIPDGAKALLSRWNHSAMVGGDLPVGEAVVRSVGDEVRAEVTWFDSPAGQEAADVVRRLRPEWSWGFRIKKHDVAEVNGRPARRLLAVDLAEVSPVWRGASIGSRTVSAGKDDAARRAAECEFLRFAALQAGIDLDPRRELARIRARVSR